MAAPDGAPRRSLRLKPAEKDLVGNNTDVQEAKCSKNKSGSQLCTNYNTAGKADQASKEAGLQLHMGRKKKRRKTERKFVQGSAEGNDHVERRTSTVTHSMVDLCALGALDIQSVKSALHLSAVPDIVLCREAEQSKVFNFCKHSIQQQEAGSLYVCGCPGTGKTLIMEEVKLHAGKWAEEVGLPAPQLLSLNCTSLTNSWDIFQKISKMLSLREGNKSAYTNNSSLLRDVKHQLWKTGISRTSHSRKMLLLIVDEMDYLIMKDQSVLYELFGLSSHVSSRCILIGIANAIDLTDRFLPKLQTLNCQPKIVTFSAYTKDQLLIVINQRLKAFPTIFHPAALELCARKVAAASGDMRKALNVCRSALEVWETEKSSGLGEDVHDVNAYFGASNSGKLMFEREEPKERKEDHLQVQLNHMAQALAKTFRSTAVETIKHLPKHQQMVLCSAVRLFHQGKKDATLAQLNAAYVEFCKSTDMPALSVLEFSSLCGVLSDQGLLNLKPSKEDRLKRVSLQVDKDDIRFALQGTRFFRNNLV